MFCVQVCYCGSLQFYLQDEADNSNAPHISFQAHRLIADNLRGHKLRRAMHHHQRLTLL